MEQLQLAADYIQNKLSSVPKLGIILGSGLGSLIDSVEMSSEEYKESYRKNPGKYKNYEVTNKKNFPISDKLNELTDENAKRKNKFNKTIKTVLFKEIAKELEISLESVKTIVEVSLNRQLLILPFSNIAEMLPEDSNDFDVICFNGFMSEYFIMDESMPEYIYELVKNELLLLRLKV